jgi:hypothetical protein
MASAPSCPYTVSPSNEADKGRQGPHDDDSMVPLSLAGRISLGPHDDVDEQGTERSRGSQGFLLSGGP